MFLERLFIHFRSSSSDLLCLLSRPAAIVITPSVCRVDMALNWSKAARQYAWQPSPWLVILVLGMNWFEGPEYSIPGRRLAFRHFRKTDFGPSWMQFCVPRSCQRVCFGCLVVHRDDTPRSCSSYLSMPNGCRRSFIFLMLFRTPSFAHFCQLCLPIPVSQDNLKI